MLSTTSEPNAEESSIDIWHLLAESNVFDKHLHICIVERIRESLLSLLFTNNLSLLDIHPHVCEVAYPSFDQVLPRLLLVRQHRLKHSEKLQWRLVQLHIRNLSTQTNSRSISKRHIILVVLASLFIIFQPTLRPENTSVRAVDVFIAVHDPWVTGYFQAFGDVFAEEIHAAFVD